MYTVSFEDGDVTIHTSISASEASRHLRHYADGHICSPECPACQMAEQVVAQRQAPAPKSWPRWARERVDGEPYP